MPPALRQSLRVLGRHRRFTALSVLSLGIAIGLNTTLYSVLDALMNPALEMRDHRDLYRISFYGDFRRMVPQEEKDRMLAALPIVADLASASGSFGGNLAERGRMFRAARVANISPDYFGVVGVAPLHGRLLTSADVGASPTPVVVSEVFWRQFLPDQAWFDSATVLVDGAPRRIVGVLPYAADFPGAQTDIWQIPRAEVLAGMQKTILRVKHGVTKQQADVALQDVAKQIGLRSGEPPKEVAYRIKPAIGDPFTYQRFHLAMIGSVFAVLLVACVNLANLQLARGMTRTREFATRAAVGATRGTLIRQLLLESAWLAGGGMLLGLVLTFWGMSVVESSMTRSLSDYVVRPQVSWRLFAFACGVALLSLSVIGLVPAIQLSRIDINELLKSGSGTGRTRRHRRQYGALVVVQVGLAMTLMVFAGLLLRTAAIVFRIQPNPAYEKLVFAYPRLTPQNRTDSLQTITSASRAIVARSRTVPGVADAATTRWVQPRGRALTIFRDGAPVSVPTMLWSYAVASPSIIRATAATITKGRDFSEEEFAEPLAIVDEGTAVFLWPGEDPIGKQLRLGADSTPGPLVRVVGVARTPPEWYGMRTTHEVERLRPRLGRVYVLESLDTGRVGNAMRNVQLIVRGTSDVHRIPLLLRRTFAEAGSKVTILQASTFAERTGLKGQRDQMRFMASLFTILAVMAMAVAALGVYSVVSHSVFTRTREFGVRIALGATLAEIRQSVFKEGNVLSLLGIAVGLLIVARTAPMLRAFLMSEDFVHDSWLHAIVAAFLFGVTLLASWIPARRAMRIDPVVALKND